MDLKYKEKIFEEYKSWLLTGNQTFYEKYMYIFQFDFFFFIKLKIEIELFNFDLCKIIKELFKFQRVYKFGQRNSQAGNKIDN